MLIALAAMPGFEQNPPASGDNSAVGTKPSRTLPASCLAEEHTSQQVRVLLDVIRHHATAGAYNTLGALFAQADRIRCAIGAFESALRLDGQNWQAHYNLGLAFL